MDKKFKCMKDAVKFAELYVFGDYGHSSVTMADFYKLVDEIWKVKDTIKCGGWSRYIVFTDKYTHMTNNWITAWNLANRDKARSVLCIGKMKDDMFHVIEKWDNQ